MTSRWLVVALLLHTASCSLLIDNHADQCASDNDCARFEGTTCDLRARLCKPRDPSIESDAASEVIDAQADSCSTITSFENACTNAACKRFDTRMRLTRLPLDGGLTPLPIRDSGVLEAGRDAVAADGGGDASSPDASGHAMAVDCSVDLMNPIYIAGSTAVKPFLAEIGKILVTQSPPVTLVYSGQGSCTGVSAILGGTAVSGPYTYWDSVGAEQTCTSSAPVIADLGVSDVFAQTCVKLPGGLPSNVGDFLGPVQTMTFVVPKSSTQQSISSEAAYYIYGFGADSGAEPWTNESVIFQRDALSGTQRMVAAAIGVDASLFRGTSTTGSGDMKTKVSTAAPAEGALGILSTDVAQENRAILSILAYQHTGQNCGYYPDREESSNEKQNVRDGHYSIWGPLHLLTILNNAGYPKNPKVADIIGFMTGTKPPPLGLDLIALEAQRHVVPQCAMHVTRTEEIGSLASFAPPQSCGCYYEKVANGSTTCTPCTNKTQCPATAPICSYGYCEMH